LVIDPTLHSPQPIRIEISQAPGEPPGLLDRLSKAAGIFKAILWPLVIIAVAIWLRNPIRAIAQVLPDKILSASKVSFFSFSLEVQRQATARGTPQVAAVLRKISPAAIEQLLKVGKDGGRGLVYNMTNDAQGEHGTASDAELVALSELEQNGLIEVSNRGQVAPNWIEQYRKILPSLAGARQQQTREGPTWYFATSPRSSELAGYFYRQTELGNAAVDTIISVVVEQMKPVTSRSEMKSEPES
jgi:hypothetical protein